MLLEQTPSWLTHAFCVPGWREAIAAYYERALSQIPVRCESHIIQTDFGETHLLAAGDQYAPPLVLLHGRAVNATVWADQLVNLARDHRVYAIDVVGEGGMSADRHPFTWNVGYAAWLVEVFERLAIRRAHVVGMSFGGWLSLKLALHAPHRVRKLTLLAPAGFTWAQLGFVMRGMQAASLPHPERTRRFIEFLSAPGRAIDENDCELLHMVFCYHHTNPEPPPPFRDSQLRRLNMPIQLLIGEHDRVFSPHDVLKRARSNLPGLREAAILPGVGHGILRDNAELVMNHMRAFISQDT
jgi:pimeloyl-ACP methyl ester carboxylesterase